MTPRGIVPLAVFILALCCVGCAPLDLGTSTDSRFAPVKPESDRSHTVRITSVLRDPDGKPLTGIFSVLFAIYEQPREGAPMWQEVQNVEPDARGHFSATIGSTKSDEIPGYIFTDARSRWLGMQALLPGEVERPRLRLASTPQGLVAVQSMLALPMPQAELQAPAQPVQPAPLPDSTQ
jgi:hypothetical protein